MRYFPYENFYIISKLKPNEVQEKLQEVVSPDSGFIFSLRGYNTAGPNTPFKGYALNGAFEFKPAIIYRNAFLPQIKGSTEAYLDGSRVHVKMTLYIFVMIFMSIWLVGAGLVCLAFVPKFINNKHTETDIIPYCMFLFGYLLVTYGFKSESLSSKSFLVELLDGKIE